MPLHANCVVPGCPNRNDHCKWGLFPSEEDVQGRKVYVKRRLCGSPSCKSVLFHRLPKDVGARAVLSKKWLARIPRENTPLTPNNYICGIHFPAGHPDEDNDSPFIFLGKLVISKRYTRASTKGDFHVTTSMPKPHSAADISSIEHMSDVCSAMLTCPIDQESLKDEKIKELESTIKNRVLVQILHPSYPSYHLKWSQGCKQLHISDSTVVLSM